jgi:hypothetical protein
LFGFPYWYSITQSGFCFDSSFARRTASLEPPAAGENTIRAPYACSNCRRSSEVFSGITHTRP